MARQLITLDQAAEMLALGKKTLRRRIADGSLTGYRLRNTRSLRVDLAEVEALAEPIPTVNGTPAA